MSEYKCPEEGCTYAAAFVGEVTTDEDYEMQQHHFEDIREHEEWHRLQEDNKEPLAAEATRGQWSPELMIPIVEADRDAASDHERSSFPIGISEVDRQKLVLLQSINDSLLDLRKLVRPKVYGSTSVINMPQNSSLSVDTPNGAVGGTPESTERDQHPARAGRKKPSAAATAEGNETNTNPARGIERN